MEFLFEALMPTTLFVAIAMIVSFDLIVFSRSELSLQDSFQYIRCSSTIITSIVVKAKRRKEEHRVSENDLVLDAQDRNIYFSLFLLSVLLPHSLIICSLSVDFEFAKFSFDNSRDTSRASYKHSMMMGSMYFLANIIGAFFLERLLSTKV
jgi:hypothetical protein